MCCFRETLRNGVEQRVLQPSTVPNRYTVPWHSSLFTLVFCVDPRQRLLQTVVYVGGLHDLTV